MSRRGASGYREYRGRRSNGSLVLKIIVILLVILLVAGVLFVLFLGKYVEYTDDGVRLDLPWNQDTPTAAPVYSDPVVVVSPDPTPEPTPTPQPLTDIAAVEVTADQLVSGAAAQMVTDAGGNALVVTMKESSGKLLWQSEAELARTYDLNAADKTVSWAIRDLAEQDQLYLIAKIDCFRDAALAKDDGLGAALRTRGGNIWYDAEGLCWVSPVSDTVTAYLTTLCLELADMGFDEIVLDSAGYPCAGEVSVLATDDNRPEDRAAPVAAFYETLTRALADRDTALSIVVNELPQPEEGSYSGVTMAAVSQYAHRVWLAEGLDAEDCASQLRAAGMDDAAKRLVLIGGASEQGSWAQLN